jgi:hypothetical protein
MAIRLLKFCLIAALSVGLTACGDDKKDSKGKTDSGTSTSDPTGMGNENILEGDKCDPDTFNGFCRNNSAYFCTTGTVETDQCGTGDSDDLCIVFSKLDNNLDMAYCVTEDDKCSEAGVDEYCEDWNTFALMAKDVCAKGSNGELYSVFIPGDDCIGYCDADGKKCLPQLVSDQGQACTEDGRPERCDGTIVSWCSTEGLSPKVSAWDCAEDGAICEMIEGVGYCADSSSECQVEGESSKQCINDLLGSYVATATCKKADSGKLYKVVVDEEECDNACSEGACIDLKTIVSDYGDNCDESRADRCDGTYLSFCSNGKVSAYDCSEFGGGCVNVDEGVDCEYLDL